MIINRHPAVVEVLGESYPLYADTVEETEKLLESGDMDIFYRASRYMKENVDLSRYEWKHFQSGVERIFAKDGWKERMESVHGDILMMPPCDLIPEGGRLYVEAMENFASYMMQRESCQTTQMVKEEYVTLEDQKSEDAFEDLVDTELISVPLETM